MANWTVSNYVNNETVGDNVNAGSMSTYADLVITPLSGYNIDKTKFKIGGATESPTNTWTGGNIDAQVHKVEFLNRNSLTGLTEGDSGYVAVANADENLVTARVWFDSSAVGGTPWSMPGNDLEVYIDIDEKETVATQDRYLCLRSHTVAVTDSSGNNKHTVTYASAPTGITTTNETPLVHNLLTGSVSHLHTGTVADDGTAKTIFEITFATNTTFGYYYDAIPTSTINYGSGSGTFQITANAGTFANMTVNGSAASVLVSVTLKCEYTPDQNNPDPMSSALAMCELGQSIAFKQRIKQEDQGEPGSLPTITKVSTNLSDIIIGGETRQTTVSGSIGSQFTMAVTRTGDGHTYDFTSNTFTSAGTTSSATTITATGQYVFYIVYPDITGGSNQTYDITINPDPPTTTVSPPVPLVAGDLRLYQYLKPVVSLAFADPGGIWGEGTASGDIFNSDNTKITLTSDAGRVMEGSSSIFKTFSYTVKPAHLDAGSGTLNPKDIDDLDWTLDSAVQVITDTNGAPSGTSFTVDSNTNITAGDSISWNAVKYPIFNEEAVRDLRLSTNQTTEESGSQEADVNDIVVGMVVTSVDIPSETVITVTAVGDEAISVSSEISLAQGIPLTFTTSGITVSSVSGSTTVVASQTLAGVTDNKTLTFGGSGEGGVMAGVEHASALKVGSDIVIKGSFVVTTFPTENITVNMDLSKLITVS